MDSDDGLVPPCETLSLKALSDSSDEEVLEAEDPSVGVLVSMYMGFGREEHAVKAYTPTKMDSTALRVGRFKTKKRR